jgi:hypothetical protein
MQCQLPKARYDEIAGYPASQVSNGANIETIVKMQLDIIALAVSCGKTHAATLQIAMATTRRNTSSTA